jgi:hypothetical protein
MGPSGGGLRPLRAGVEVLDDAQVLAEIFQSGPAPEPVAVVNLINDKTGFEDNHVGDHGIVDRIRAFGDVEIFLDDASRVACRYQEMPAGLRQSSPRPSQASGAPHQSSD